MRISDWSSDVCSSDLIEFPPELIDGPVLETADLPVRQQLRLGVARHAQRRPYDAQIPQRLERAQRIGIIFALIIDSAHPRPLDEIVGQDLVPPVDDFLAFRSEEHTYELQSLLRISYAVL